MRVPYLVTSPFTVETRLSRATQARADRNEHGALGNNLRMLDAGLGLRRGRPSTVRRVLAAVRDVRCGLAAVRVEVRAPAVAGLRLVVRLVVLVRAFGCPVCSLPFSYPYRDLSNMCL